MADILLIAKCSTSWSIEYEYLALSAPYQSENSMNFTILYYTILYYTILYYTLGGHHEKGALWRGSAPRDQAPESNQQWLITSNRLPDLNTVCIYIYIYKLGHCWLSINTLQQTNITNKDVKVRWLLVINSINPSLEATMIRMMLHWWWTLVHLPCPRRFFLVPASRPDCHSEGAPCRVGDSSSCAADWIIQDMVEKCCCACRHFLCVSVGDVYVKTWYWMLSCRDILLFISVHNITLIVVEHVCVCIFLHASLCIDMYLPKYRKKSQWLHHAWLPRH